MSEYAAATVEPLEETVQKKHGAMPPSPSGNRATT